MYHDDTAFKTPLRGQERFMKYKTVCLILLFSINKQAFVVPLDGKYQVNDTKDKDLISYE